MASPFDRIMNTARMRLPGAVDDAMRQELFEVCLDFFRDAAIWQDDIEFVLLAGGIRAEVFPQAGRILKIMEVKADGRKCFGFRMDDEGVIVAPHPFSKTIVYTATFMMTVTDPVTRDAFPIIPLEIVGRHHNVFLEGLLAKMMSHPSKPYTNIQMAAYHQNRFKGSISRARNEKHTGNAMGAQRWTFPRFS